jgi:hypothetical protein
MELVHEIMSLLHGDACTLAACSRVCHQWHPEARELLRTLRKVTWENAQISTAQTHVARRTLDIRKQSPKGEYYRRTLARLVSHDAELRHSPNREAIDFASLQKTTWSIRLKHRNSRGSLLSKAAYIDLFISSQLQDVERLHKSHTPPSCKADCGCPLAKLHTETQQLISLLTLCKRNLDTHAPTDETRAAQIHSMATAIERCIRPGDTFSNDREARQWAEKERTYMLPSPTIKERTTSAQ